MNKIRLKLFEYLPVGVITEIIDIKSKNPTLLSSQGMTKNKNWK